MGEQMSATIEELVGVTLRNLDASIDSLWPSQRESDLVESGEGARAATMGYNRLIRGANEGAQAILTGISTLAAVEAFPQMAESGDIEEVVDALSERSRGVAVGALNEELSYFGLIADIASGDAWCSPADGDVRGARRVHLAAVAAATLVASDAARQCAERFGDTDLTRHLAASASEIASSPFTDVDTPGSGAECSL